jgi:hypothetical protein
VLPREMMPENTQFITLLTPQGWALDAYRELLGGSENYQPNATILLRSCGVLAALGTLCFGLACWFLRLE